MKKNLITSYEPDWDDGTEDDWDDEDCTFCPTCGGRESSDEDCACIH